MEAKEGTKLEQKARRGETQQQARKRSKEGGKREARERWRRRAVEAKEQHWLVCYQQQVPVKQTFNVSSKPSLSPSRADLPPFFLSFSFPFSPLFSSLPSPRTRFLVIDSSIDARPISPHQPIRELISSRTTTRIDRRKIERNRVSFSQARRIMCEVENRACKNRYSSFIVDDYLVVDYNRATCYGMD